MRAERSSASWKPDAAILTDDNLWNRANLVRDLPPAGVVERVGAFDERLGLGSPEPWSSGEETDYLIRAVRAGARIEYDPSLVVRHDVRDGRRATSAPATARASATCCASTLPGRVVARMLVRPVGGVLVSLGCMDDRGSALPARDVPRSRPRAAVAGEAHA